MVASPSEAGEVAAGRAEGSGASEKEASGAVTPGFGPSAAGVEDVPTLSVVDMVCGGRFMVARQTMDPGKWEITYC